MYGSERIILALDVFYTNLLDQPHFGDVQMSIGAHANMIKRTLSFGVY
jgi:hypothetical protein